MYRGSGPKIFPLIVVILVIALVIAALVSVGRMIFMGNGSSDNNNNAQDSKQATAAGLQASTLDTGDKRAVRLTVRGPIIADEKFRSYQITMSPSERRWTVYSGYLGQVIEEKVYTNNTKAYEQFVYALDKANISKIVQAKDEDFRGVCATRGIAFMYETLNDNDVDQSVWTSTCGGSKGTMGANVEQIHALFANQIPDFKRQFSDIY